MSLSSRLFERACFLRHFIGQRVATLANRRGRIPAQHQRTWMSGEALEGRVMLTAVSWDGGGDGANWSDAINWSGNALPGTDDDVTIDIAGNAVVTLNFSTSIKSLLNREELRLSSASLTTSDGATNEGTLVALSTDTITGAFGNAEGAALRVEGNSSVGSGTLTVASGFTNAGTIDLTNPTTTGFSSTLNVTAGTLTNASTGSIRALAGSNGAAGRFVNAQIDNQGTIDVLTALTISKAGADHLNTSNALAD